MCYLSKTFKYSHFVPLFLAHEDVVDGFVIFHTKLSTLRLGSFICLSLVCKGDGQTIITLKVKKKSTPPRYVKVGGHPMESVSHGLRKEKRWGGVQGYKRAPKCQLIKHLGTALTCLLWKISRTSLLVIDKSNHLLK
jgi:hypothetical protein